MADDTKYLALIAQQKQIKKELKAERKRLTEEQDVETWKRTSDVLKECNKLLTRAGFSKNTSLKKLAQLPVYYTLQDPNNKKLKADDINVGWVQDFIRAGGTEMELRSQADSTRSDAWKKAKSRLRGKRKKSSSKTDTEKKTQSTDDKGRAKTMTGVG